MAEKQIVWKAEKGNINTRQWWLRALLISVLQLILVWGICRLVSNVFGLQEASGSVKFKLIILLFTLSISLWTEWSLHVEEKEKKRIGNVVLLIGLALVLGLSYGGVISELAEGFRALGNTYIDRWNVHSGEYRSGSARAAVMPIAIELLLLVVMPVMQMLGGMACKRRIVLGVPICIICMGLLVMAVPRWSDLAILLISGVLFFYFDSVDSISWKRLVVLSAGTLLLIGITGHFQKEAQAQMLSLNEEWFDYLEDTGNDFELPQWSADRDVIDNIPPEFENKQVILLTISKNVSTSIYLRGYHCGNYVDGVWERDTKAFQEACKEYGISEEEAAEKLILFQHEQEDLLDNQQVEYELSYTGIKNEYCYFPYGVGWEETSENYELSQDYIIKKKKNNKVGKAVGWQQLYHLDVGVDVSEEYSSFQEWYDDFAYENYLTVPDNQNAVKNLASQMSLDAQFTPYMMYLNPEQNSYDEVNASRLQVAYLVAEWLKDYGTYSLELDELSGGTDAVEYFLAKSHEGFCEHFASAGTLILRELGVPARYTPGYIVKAGSLKALNNKYATSVLDSQAHAWTEVYLEHYGWVPIEMTPGYGGSADIMSEPNATATPKPDDTVIQPDDTEPEEEEEPTEAPTETPDDMDESQGGATGSVELFPIIVLLGLVVLLGFAGYCYMVGNKGRSMKRLTGYMRHGETRKAVKWINDAIYRQLVRKERKFKRITDGEFLMALKSEFPEVEEIRWDAYFEVVRRTVYSVEEISEEEMEECYALYKVVQQSRKQKR